MLFETLTVGCVGVRVCAASRSSPGVVLISLDKDAFQQTQQDNSWEETEQTQMKKMHHVPLSLMPHLSHLSWWSCTWTTVSECGLTLAKSLYIFVLWLLLLRCPSSPSLFSHFPRPIYWLQRLKAPHLYEGCLKDLSLDEGRTFQTLWFCVLHVGQVSPEGRVLISQQTRAPIPPNIKPKGFSSSHLHVFSSPVTSGCVGLQEEVQPSPTGP